MCRPTFAQLKRNLHQPQSHTLLDRELYLPKSWTLDPDRCRAADVPEEVSFATST